MLTAYAEPAGVCGAAELSQLLLDVARGKCGVGFARLDLIIELDQRLNELVELVQIQSAGFSVPAVVAD